MSEVTKPKRQGPKIDRVVLSNKASEKVKGWVLQLEPLLTGSKMNISALTSWCLEIQSDELSDEHKNELVARLHDEVRFVRWAEKELIADRKRGGTLTLADLLAQRVPQVMSLNSSKPPRKRKLKSSQSVVREPDTEAVLSQNESVSRSHSDENSLGKSKQ